MSTTTRSPAKIITTETAWVRRTLIGVALLFVLLFLVLPLAAVFTEAVQEDHRGTRLLGRPVPVVGTPAVVVDEWHPMTAAGRAANRKPVDQCELFNAARPNPTNRAAPAVAPNRVVFGAPARTAIREATTSAESQTRPACSTAFRTPASG